MPDDQAGITDVLLVGFGAVGIVYAWILKRSGRTHVTVVARSNYEATKEHGVQIESVKYGNIDGWRPDRVVKSVGEAADRPYSYVFLTTKAIPELLPTSRILEPLLCSPYADTFPQPIYILLQNGLNVEVDLYHAAKKLGKGEPRIISAALFIATNLLAPNVVHHGPVDRVTLGVYRHQDYTTEKNTPEEAAMLEDVGEILALGGTTVSIVPEVQRCKFFKNLWNVAFSSFATLTHYRLPSIFRSPPEDSSSPYTPYLHPSTANLIRTYTIPTIRAALEELIVLGRALGYPDTPDGLPSSAVENTIERTEKLHRDPKNAHKPSMMLDMEQKRPIEVEVILGEAVRMAKARGVEMPRVEMLYALLLVVQNQILRQMETGDSE